MARVNRFVLYQDGVGEWRWTAYSASNRVLADSGEGYTGKSTALDRLKAFRDESGDWPIYERNPDGADPQLG